MSDNWQRAMDLDDGSLDPDAVTDAEHLATSTDRTRIPASIVELHCNCGASWLLDFRMSDTLIEDSRFWSKVDASGDCWVWTAAVKAKGYGLFSSISATGRNSSGRNVSRFPRVGILKSARGNVYDRLKIYRVTKAGR